VNVTKIVVEEDDKNNHVIIATTLSEAAEATDSMDKKCDEIRKMMKSIKIYE